MIEKKVDHVIGSIIRSREDASMRVEKVISQKDVLDILNAADEVLCSEPVIINVPPHVKVVGDIHGNIDDLLRIFEINGYPPKTNYLFLGDYVDRGLYSFEVAITLLALKVKYPKNVFLIRGNHEIQHISETYGFLDELQEKYSSMLFYAFHSVFVQLPLIALVGERIVCVHGGIGPTMKKLSHFKKMIKPDDISDGSVFADIVWSDPRDQAKEFTENSRGCGFYFNAKALHKFLALNDLDLLIRSHELCNGCSFPYKDSNECITVFSNTDYCGRKNNAAVIVVDGSQVTKKSLPYLRPEEKKKWKPTYPEWLITETKKHVSESGDEYDEPNSEIELHKRNNGMLLSYDELHPLVA